MIQSPVRVLFPARHRFSIFLALALLALILAPLASIAGNHKSKEKEKVPPTVREQIRSLESMCAENAEARAKADKEKSLYERLGGEEKIRGIVTEIVRLHDKNKDFERFMGDVDQELLIERVTQFLVIGAGGSSHYEGRNMTDAHAHLKLTNADFLSAGGDVMQAMKNKGCEQPEINEVVCMLVSLRSEVVIDSDKNVD